MNDNDTRVPSNAVTSKKAYEAPRVDDLGDAIEHTHGSEGVVSDGAAGAFQDRHHWSK